MPLTDPLRDAELLVRSGHPFLSVETPDLPRIRSLLLHLAGRMELPLFRWTRARGITRLDREGAIYRTEEAERALRHIAASDLAALYLFEGLDAVFPGDALLRAKTVEALERLKAVGGALIHAGGALELPGELAGRATSLPLPAPTREELRTLLGRIVRDLNQRRHVSVELSGAELDRFLDHLRGLTLMEAEKILTRALLEDGRLTLDDLDHVADAKRRVIEREGVLEYYPVEESLAEVADLEGLKSWLRRRTALIRDPERAREFGLDFPKGVLLTGVPGCGKSLCARAVATEWGLPLLRLDPSSLYNKYIGESERNFRRAMTLAEEMAPVVLWIDEIEKAFASGEGEDGGVSRRILGTFLNWMQERRDGVFVLATANQVDQLPPELLRKGRFDEVFFVDLPNAEARAEILRIHLRSRSRDPDQVDVAALAGAAEEFSGAELEQVVVSALYGAFAGDGEFGTDLLLAEIRGTRPLSVTAAERIGDLRAWARERTVSAN
jgi:SpoVK/Ycf46/Vps4 family AAA+-type ATPase